LEELEVALLRLAINPSQDLIYLIGADERGLLRVVRHILLDDESIELVLLID
jgi:hypothetical protein